MLRKTLRMCSLLLLHHFSSFAQYCTPAPTSGGVYINHLHFNSASGLTEGTAQSSNATPTYSDRSGTPIGTAQRACNISMFFNVANPATTAAGFNLRVFVDWNGDNDFADSSEIAFDYDYASLGGGSSLGTGLNIMVPAFAATSNRMRFVIRQGTQKASPCGTFTGNAQDYTLTVPANVAPTLNTAVTPLFNDLLETQTNNEGISVRQFIYSQSPASPLVTSGESCESGGLAITGVNGTNGLWQYKTKNGNWTNIGSVSTTNALLLDGGLQSNDISSRVRFVPSGAGTASITYKGWDRSQGVIGQYINATTDGGSTAFSTASKTTSVTVLSAASVANDVKMYLPDYSSPSNEYNLYITSLNRSTGAMKQADRVTVANDDGFGTDIAIDATNQKVVWSGGISGADVFRCNMDGTGITKINGTGYNYITGVAASNSKLFFCDYGNGLFCSNLDGTSVVPLSGGAGQATNINEVYDIECGNGKIWYINRAATDQPFSVVSANANGTGTTVLYTATNSNAFIGGLAVTATNVYWSESSSTYTATIKRMNIATGTITTLSTESGQQYLDLLVDETNSLIYFSAYDNDGTNLPFSNSYIKTIPLAGGTPVRRLLSQNIAYSFVFYVPTVVLPVKVLSIDANKQAQQITVQWKVTGEQEVADYTIQKSTDGIHFQEVGKLPATGKSTYIWPDANPAAGANYYRISIAGKDGKATLTNTVKVDWLKESKPAVSVYPSIVPANRQVQVAWQNVVPGSYTIKLVNTVGQSINLSTVKVSGNSVQTFELPATLTAGAYWLQVGNGTAVWNQKVIVP